MACPGHEQTIGHVVTLSLICSHCQKKCRFAELTYCLNCQQPFCSKCRPGMSATLACGCPVENSRMYKLGQKMALDREERLLKALLGD